MNMTDKTNEFLVENFTEKELSAPAALPARQTYITRTALSNARPVVAMLARQLWRASLLNASRHGATFSEEQAQHEQEELVDYVIRVCDTSDAALSFAHTRRPALRAYTLTPSVQQIAFASRKASLTMGVAR